MNQQAEPDRAGRAHAIVVADGDAPTRAALDVSWPGWSADAALVVAADAGARTAAALGLTIDVVVGDGDSLGAEALEGLAASGVEIVRAPTDKDETDTELALVEARSRGATSITILGALGGPRVDHALANVALLAHPALAGAEAAILDPRARLRLLVAADEPADLPLPGAVGGVVSLLPFGGDAEGVTTRGFRYPLRDEPLPIGPARGLSNVRTGPDAGVSLRRGRLLVVEVAVTLAG